MKIEIYQVGKVPPLTVVECDDWLIEYDNNTPRLKCYSIKKFELLREEKRVIAIFVLSNIAGFKEVGEDNTSTEEFLK